MFLSELLNELKRESPYLNVVALPETERKELAQGFKVVTVLTVKCRGRATFVARPQKKQHQPAGLVVILKTEVCDQVFATQMAECVFKLHQLDEDVVLGIEAGRGHW